ILTVGGPLCHANEDMLRDLVAYKDIHLLTNAKIVDANDQEFVLQNKDGEETILNADSAILAVGYTPQQSLYEDIQNEVSESYLIGDAKQVQ
ncbi:2-enoate reductase, partial [Paenibacillus sp. EKM208P]